jgi:hypothetical protein
MNPRYDSSKVFEAAERMGYIHVLTSLAGSSIGEILSNPRKRGWCPNPNHSQKSGQAFRLFKDVDQSGGCICNTCGSFPNIVSTLEFINGWDYPTIINEIARVTDVEAEPEYDLKSLFSKVREYGDLTLLTELSGGKLPQNLAKGLEVQCPCCNTGQLTIEAFGQSNCTGCGPQKNLTETLGLVMGWDFNQTVGMIANYLDVESINGSKNYQPPAQQAKTETPVRASRYSDEEIQTNKEKLKKIIAEALPLSKQKASHIAANYLRSRGLNPSATLQRLAGRVWVHPNLPYYETVIDEQRNAQYVKRGCFPALLILFYSKDGEPINVHRIYLNPNGHGKISLTSADGKPLDVKKSMKPAGEMNGGYMAITEPKGDIMAVAEGYETSLVPEQVFNFPTRAASAGMAKAVVVPDHVSKVLFFADPDKAGIKNAESFQARMTKEGKTCFILYPPSIKGNPGADWLDALNEFGSNYLVEFVKGLLSTHTKRAA